MPSRKPIGRCVVTYGRSLMSLEIAHSLARQGVEVIGCDDVDLTVMAFSKDVKSNFVHASSSKNPERFIDDLVRQCEKHKPKDDIPYVLMPAFRDVELISKHRHRFEPWIKLTAPHADTIARVHPKQNLAETARSLGAHAPETKHFSDKDSLLEAARAVGFPVVVKPVDGVGGRGVKQLDDEDALHAHFDKNAASYEGGGLVQEPVPGDDYCLTVLYQDGELKAHMAYRNLMKMPAESGAGILRETIDDTPFLEVADKLFAPIKWNGVAEIDFRWDGNPETKPALIEVNPRFWAGLFHSIVSGVDFPWLLYQMTVTGEVSEASEAKIGQRSKVPGLWLLASIQGIASSDLHFSRMEDAWEEARDQLKERKMMGALKAFAKKMGKTADMKDANQRMKLALADAKGAPAELLSSRDPMASLGILFVVASLVRHGKLPPELTYK